ncbi:hypothetical protein PMAYCL1PPCAC_03120, partial [Pristionchus mayeri]
EHLPYNILICIKFVLCSLGAVAVAIQWCRGGVSWLVHVNSRILFSYYYAILIVQSASFGLLYGFEFFRFRFACWEFYFRIVLVVRTIGVAAVFASHYIMMTITIERLFSSIRPQQFEQCSSRICGLLFGSLNFEIKKSNWRCSSHSSSYSTHYQTGSRSFRK